MEFRENGFNEEENVFTEEQAQRLVQWVINHGHTEAEANEALAYVMGAAVTVDL